MPASSSGKCHPARRSRLVAAGMAALVFLGVAGATRMSARATDDEVVRRRRGTLTPGVKRMRIPAAHIRRHHSMSST